MNALSTKTLTIRTARTYTNKPLMVLDGGLFNGTELTPHQVRFLAAALVGVADAVAEEDVTARHWRPRTIVIHDPLGNTAPEVA